MIYLNRLSDLLFVLARAVNQRGRPCRRAVAEADRLNRAELAGPIAADSPLRRAAENEPAGGFTDSCGDG